MSIAFVQDGDSRLYVGGGSAWRDIASEQGLLKKNGDMMSRYSRTPSATYPSLPGVDTELLMGKSGLQSYVLADTGTMTKEELLVIASGIPSFLELRINGKDYSDANIEFGKIQSGDDVVWAVQPTERSATSDARLDGFMRNVSLSNGQMVGPALSDFANMIRRISPPNRKMVTGYLSVIDYYRKLGTRFDADMVDSVYTTKNELVLPDRFGYRLNLDTDTITLSISDIPARMISSSKKQAPFILFSTHPLVVMGKTLPFFRVYRYGVGLFLSPIKMEPRMLATLPGGVKLNA